MVGIDLRNPRSGVVLRLDAWIDTGFNGELVVSQAAIAFLGLPIRRATQAVLADGSEVELQTYTGELDWFGRRRRIEVITGDGQEILLGIGLLLGHQPHIDYAANTVTLT